VTIAASMPPPVRRDTTPWCSDEPTFAIVDLETTGLDAKSERVLECAVLQADSHGRIESEWSTLVAVPGIDELGAQSIHGISRAMLAGAPRFRDIAGELARRLAGRIVVGHVLAFDLEHLRAEFGRAGVCLPELEFSGLCTRELARDFLPPGPRTLAACCAAAMVPLYDAHTALGDARAAARLLAHFLDGQYPVDYVARARHARAVVWPRFLAEGGYGQPAMWARRDASQQPGFAAQAIREFGGRS
jgi:DNA polymerase-3 subunit epsilon